MHSIPGHRHMITLHQLHHQAVRDLAWCCFSAPMMDELPGTDAAILPFDNQSLWPWLHQLDRNPQPLLDHLSQLKSTRLGIYYEALWHFYFANHPEWDLLQHNLQVARNGITLGAFDFLCRRGEEYWHIETAVKFYLCNTNNPLEAHDWKYWIGPAGEDRLDLKLNHLRQHQLPLHQTAEAKPFIKSLYPDVKTWSTGLCLQGYLFSPAKSPCKPAFCNSQHSHGSWWFACDLVSDLSEQISDEQTPGAWLILERNQWLAPAQEKRQDVLLSNEQLAEKLKDGLDRPLLIAVMQLNELDESQRGSTNGWIEKSRFFVVPDNWPI